MISVLIKNLEIWRDLLIVKQWRDVVTYVRKPIILKGGSVMGWLERFLPLSQEVAMAKAT